MSGSVNLVRQKHDSTSTRHLLPFQKKKNKTITFAAGFRKIWLMFLVLNLVVCWCDFEYYSMSVLDQSDSVELQSPNHASFPRLNYQATKKKRFPHFLYFPSLFLFMVYVLVGYKPEINEDGICQYYLNFIQADYTKKPDLLLRN